MNTFCARARARELARAENATHFVRRVNKDGSLTKLTPIERARSSYSGPDAAQRASERVAYLERLNPGTHWIVETCNA